MFSYCFLWSFEEALEILLRNLIPKNTSKKEIGYNEALRWLDGQGII